MPREDEPLPLRDTSNAGYPAGDGAAYPPGAYPEGIPPPEALSAACAAAATAPPQRDGAYSLAALNYNAKRERFSAYDEAADGKLGSVYTRVTDVLLSRGDWDRRPALRNKATGELKLPSSYHLLLGTAQGKGVPWGRLGYGVWPPPLVNYCRGFEVLTRKGKLVGTLQSARDECGGGWPEEMPPELTRGAAVPAGAEPWELAPTAFVFHPSKGDANPREEFRRAFAAAATAGGPNLWVLKPSEGAKGEGIFILSDLDEIEAHLERQEARSAEGEAVSSWVVQRYVHNPLLLSSGDRKFDMRCWVLVDATYSVFLYRQGVLRVASAPYVRDDVGNRFSHLTNHCIATQHADYGKYEPTNEIFYDAFDAELCERFPHVDAAAAGGSVLEAAVLPQIRRHVVQSLLAARATLEHDPEYYRSFQVFGYDFILDDDLRVHLCEVNASPAVADELLPKFARALVAEAIDPHLPPNATLVDEGARAREEAERNAPGGRDEFECIFRSKAGREALEAMRSAGEAGASAGPA